MTSLLVGAGAKHEASPNARRRDAPNASGRLVGGVGGFAGHYSSGDGMLKMQTG